MNELNIPKKANGYICTIKSIDIATVKCPSSCSWYANCNDRPCTYKRYDVPNGVIVDNDNKEISGIKCLINIKNIGNTVDLTVNSRNAILVDTEGYTYEGTILCEKCLPLRVVKAGTEIHPQSQVDYIQLFPLLESVEYVAKIKVNINDEWVDFQITDEEVSLFDNINAIDNDNDTSRDDKVSSAAFIDAITQDSFRYDVQHINSDINVIKLNVYSRFNNILSPTEKTKIENRINNDLYRLNIDLQSKTNSIYDSVKEALKLIEDEYNQKIQAEKIVRSEIKNIDRKVKELLELSPREFEEYVGELFTHLGYKVEVTPYVNDKGVDIIMYKGAVKYGVQCKRYKGTVGSPEIQTFIGALNHAKADKGFFVTTGMFSFEAEKMAAQHPIQLVNRVELSELILEALKK